MKVKIKPVPSVGIVEVFGLHDGKEYLLGTWSCDGEYWDEYGSDFGYTEHDVVAAIPEHVKRAACGSSYKTNPKRPPKQWMDDCVAGARKSADNPGAVCGALWYHKMTPAQRRAAMKREGNPVTIPTPALFALGGAILLGFYWLGREKKKKATAASSCKIDVVKLNKWGLENGFAIIYLPTAPGLPPELSDLRDTWSDVLTGIPREQIVVITKDGTFWTYTEKGYPDLNSAMRESYCSGKELAA